MENRPNLPVQSLSQFVIGLQVQLDRLQRQFNALFPTSAAIELADGDIHDAGSLRLINRASVPTPPLGATTYWTNGVNFFATDSSAVTQTFLTGSGLAVQSDGSPSIAGNIPEYIGTSGQLITDSGRSLSEFLPLNGSAAMTGNLNLNTFRITTAGQVAFGNGATASSTGIALGTGATASAANAIAFGTGAVNGDASTCLIGNSSITNIRPGSLICNLGSTGAPFNTCYLKDSSVATASKYVMYDPLVYGNTTGESSLMGLAVGSLTYAPVQPLGLTIIMVSSLTVSANNGDSLTLRLKVNGDIMVSHILSGPLTAVPLLLESWWTVGFGIITVTSRLVLNNTHDMIQGINLVYDRNSANTLDLTGEYMVADPGNTVTHLTCIVQSIFAE